jgi:hypothetical protein
VISPTLSALNAARSRRLNARLENGAPEYPANTNSDAAKAITPGARMRRPLKLSWIAFHFLSDWLKAAVTGTSWKTLPFPLMRRATISSPTLWQSPQVNWINSSNRQAVWKRALARVEREGRAVALLPDFEIVEEPTNVGEEQVADLGLLVDRGFDLGKGVFQIPVLVGKGKRGTDLLEAGGVLPISQEPIGLQGLRERKTPRIEIERFLRLAASSRSAESP